jgi:flavin-dependent thymidylate synthase
LKVRLGGYNIDAGTIRELAGEGWREVTPEVISASYARISRDPRDVGRLRDEARKEVEGARKSNRTIVFGLGHSSVAEHAVFNFDVTGVSRLAVEEIEHFRLASFTEKSQRYIRLGKDFVLPGELLDSGVKREFMGLMRYLSAAYIDLYDGIIACGEDEETAKEDARYLMPLSTTAQFGMTVNSRELEYMISRLASHPLAELREFAGRLHGAVRRVASSLVRYPDPTDYFLSVPDVRAGIRKRAGRGDTSKCGAGPGAVLLDVTDDAERRLAASLIFSSSGISFAEALTKAGKMGKRGRADMIVSTMKKMQSHDAVWREFESVRMIFEVTVSASCFAQLKRHRMATIIVQRYMPALGISVPESVRRAGKVGLLREAASRAVRVYRAARSAAGPGSEYALLNAHRRRVLFDVNLRELYHFSRLRSDRHAQWEIRRLSDAICSLAGEAVPSACALHCGKDTFEKRSGELFG